MQSNFTLHNYNGVDCSSVPVLFSDSEILKIKRQTRDAFNKISDRNLIVKIARILGVK